MRTRYRLSRRGSRGDTFYCVDTHTSKRTSLHTSDKCIAGYQWCYWAAAFPYASRNPGEVSSVQ